MKKTSFFRLICIVLSLVFAIPVYAQKKIDEVEMMNALLKTVKSGSEISEVLGIPRGRLISHGVIRITDEGNGIIGALAETYCHVDVKEIKMRIYLDVLIDDSGNWNNLETYDYNWVNTDKVDNKLHFVGVSFEIHGLPKGYQYRLRCNHYVYGVGTEGFEGLSSRTEFIPLG